MRFLCGVIISMMLFANTAAAMTFSQPVKIGGAVRWNQTGGFMVIDATDNIVEEVFLRNGKAHNFARGVAKFGNETNAVYEHYDTSMNFDTVKVGDSDKNNTISISATTNSIIYEIVNDSRLDFYMIKTGYDIHEDDGYIILGRNLNGRFVKYFDTYEIRKNFFGDYTSVAFGDIKFKGDTIIIIYEKQTSNYRYARIGEFRFKWDDAAQWFGVEQVIYHPDETNAKIYLERGENFYKSGKESDALECYNQAIALNPYLDEAYISRSVVGYVASRTWGGKDLRNKSIADINRALEINPNSARAYRWRGEMKLTTDIASLADFDRAIKLDSNYLDAYESRADTYIRLKEYDKAIADYTHIIDSPNFETSYMQHYDFSLMSDWSWYINVDQRLAALYNKRGNAYYAKGDKSKAIADYKNALRLSPNNAWIGRPLKRDDPNALK